MDLSIILYASTMIKIKQQGKNSHLHLVYEKKRQILNKNTDVIDDFPLDHSVVK